MKMRILIHLDPLELMKLCSHISSSWGLLNIFELGLGCIPAYSQWLLTWAPHSESLLCGALVLYAPLVGGTIHSFVATYCSIEGANLSSWYICIPSYLPVKNGMMFMNGMVGDQRCKFLVTVEQKFKQKV